MKLVTAVIPPQRLDNAREALKLFGAPGLTVTSLLAASVWNRHLEVYRAEVMVADLVPRVRVDVVAYDEDAADLARVLARIGSSEHGGDDTVVVWISSVEVLVRVRMGERGGAAV